MADQPAAVHPFSVAQAFLVELAGRFKHQLAERFRYYGANFALDLLLAFQAGRRFFKALPCQGAGFCRPMCRSGFGRMFDAGMPACFGSRFCRPDDRLVSFGMMCRGGWLSLVRRRPDLGAGDSIIAMAIDFYSVVIFTHITDACV